MLKIKTTGLEEFLDPSGGSWVKALIMGNPGSGKTPTAAEWPDPIFADCERGMASVASKAVPYAEIKSEADFKALLDHLRRDSLQPPERRKYRTFVVDTVDTFQKILMNERMRAEKVDAMRKQDWGHIATKLGQHIEAMLNLPMNIVVNMHMLEDRDTDGEDEILVKKSALKGSMGAEIYNYFDLIGMLETRYVAVKGERQLVRQIRWQSEPKYPMLRARFVGFPKVTAVDFTEDDYNRIFNAVTAGVDDLPETSEVESIETAEDGAEPAPADAKGGPVDSPEVPAAKKTAKKATKKATKKAAAKAEKPAEAEKSEPEKPAEVEKAEAEKPEPTSEPAAPETGVATETEDKPVTDESETAKAEKLLEEELGAKVVDEEPAEPEKAEEPAPAAQDDERPPGIFCGDPVVANGTANAEGCGVEITAENKSKVQISRLKYKTNLCDGCYERHRAA